MEKSNKTNKSEEYLEGYRQGYLDGFEIGEIKAIVKTKRDIIRMIELKEFSK